MARVGVEETRTRLRGEKKGKETKTTAMSDKNVRIGGGGGGEWKKRRRRRRIAGSEDPRGKRGEKEAG